MAEHTELPWFTDRKFVVGPRPSTNDQSDGMLCGIADVYGDNAKEDAAFIVKACNSHEALVKALGEAITRLEDVADDTGYQLDGDFIKPEDGLIARLRAALLAAREVKP